MLYLTRVNIQQNLDIRCTWLMYAFTNAWNNSPGCSLTMCCTISAWPPSTASCRMFHPLMSSTVTSLAWKRSSHVWVLSASTGAYHWPLGSRASRRSGGHPNRRRMPEEILLRRIPPSDLHLILRWRNSFIFNLMESLLGNTQLSHLFLSFLTDLISDSTASASFFRHAVSSGVWPKGLFVSSGTDLAASSLRKDTLPSLMACITPKFLISVCQLGMICCLVDVVACVGWPLFRVGQTEEGQIVLVLGNGEVVHFLCNGTIRVLSLPWLLNLTFNQ